MVEIFLHTRRLVVALVLLNAAVQNCWADDVKPFESGAPQAILIDAKSGHVLFEKDADKQIPPASMSKLMTMIMVFEALRAGTLKLDQTFTVSENAWRLGGAASGGSTMYAVLNSQVQLSDLMQGVIVQSANDACIAIAEGMAGSEEAFAQRATERARQLGLASANFHNATGLPDPEHHMSVRELSILARYIIRTFPEYYKYYGEPEFTWNKITQQNRNPLLKDYPGADGMKTGYTKEAGYGLVGSAVRGNRRLIMVITGLGSIAKRKSEAQSLLDWGFAQFHEIPAYGKGDKVGKAAVWGGATPSVDLVTTDPVKIALSQQERATIDVKLAYKGPLMAPVKAGQDVGAVRFIVDGEAIAEAPVVAASNVEAVDSMWAKAWDSLMIMAFGS